MKSFIKKVLCTAFIFTVLLTVLFTANAVENPFNDVKGGVWYYDSVMWAYENGYAAGTSKTTFSPKSNVTRADFITMLAKFDGVNKEDYTGSCEFADVDRGTYYFEYVNWGYENALISGTTAHSFSPKRFITREEICVILKKYCEYSDCDIYTAKYAADFSDEASISRWAREGVDFAHKSSLISGYANKVNPKGNLTRAEAVTVLYAVYKAPFKVVPRDTVDIASDRQLLIEDRTLDYSKTTASFEYKQPVKKGGVFEFTQPYEGAGAVYHNIVKAPDGTYRMYYKATQANGTRRICYIESKDGIIWTRPTGIYKFFGTDTNIVTDEDYSPDNLFVFYDTNPDSETTKWKGIYGQWGDGLFCEFSPDGNSFFNNGDIQLFEDSVSNGGMFFDTLNTMYYDSIRGKYVAFVRGFHNGTSTVLDKDYVANNPLLSIRDIRYIESEDLESWSEPVQLKYDEADFGNSHMYANAISPYYRSSGLYIGMPTKLTYITEDSKTTEVYIMASRDLINWDISNAPFVTLDEGTSYVYGDGGFPCVGIIETSNKEMSFYMADYNRYYRLATLYRYALRIDGFKCAAANGNAVLETKYLDYDGSELEINFKAYDGGYITVTATDTDGKSITSEEMTSDEISQAVYFPDGLYSLCPGSIKLTFNLYNAELYSYKFN